MRPLQRPHLSPLPAGPCDSPITNPIACENTKPGNPESEWGISGAGSSSIQGFADPISVNKGDTVRFKVLTPATAYRIDIYRFGYYGGNSARKITTVQPSASLPQSQPACITQSSTRNYDCGNWSISASWQVPTDAVSGVYIAKPVRTDGTTGTSHIIFIVRDDTGHSDLLFQTSDTTWQAYNDYGGNSLYGGPGGSSYKVSYNRPFNNASNEISHWFTVVELPLVRFLERNGYNVSYFTDLDSDQHGAEILEHKVYLSVGHDEYWSAGQRANVEAARGAGVHLMFLSGNEVFWKTRWENSIDGTNTPYRTLVCYKETGADNVKLDPLPNVFTGTWRDPTFSPPADGGRPENALTGQLFMVNCCPNAALKVTAEQGKYRFWRNTSLATLAPGTVATLNTSNLLGFELDDVVDNGFLPPGLIRLSSTPLSIPLYLLNYGTQYGPKDMTHSFTLYKHSSGAFVFGTGTIQFACGLDSNCSNSGSTPDSRLQQAMINLFADMGVQSATLQAGLIPATSSTDISPPTTAITSPADGAAVQQNSSVTITGTANDTNGLVAGVEVSTDGGATWRPATGTTNWSYTWKASPPTGSRTIRVRAIDDSLNTQNPPSSITVNIQGRTCPCTIWSSSTAPATASENDGSAAELGVRFRTDQDGVITAIRFYKGSQNTGTHTGSLWTNTGTLLATATFTGETSSGWQQVNFATPVSVAKNTTYVASYHTNVGFYAVNYSYFDSAVNNSPLMAPAHTTSQPNGVYRTGATGFPNQSGDVANFWVDVVFSTSGAPQLPSLSIGNASVTEGNSGSTNAVFTVTLSSSSSQTVTVNYTTSNGTATSGSDYTATSGTLTFSPGVTSQNISVPVLGDTAVESNETFTVTLSNPSGATISQAQGTGTITNDDTLSALSIASASVAEGNAGSANLVFTVTLSPASSQSVTVNYATANGSATSGSDYTSTPGTLTFAAGVTSQTISVPILGDTLPESDETFTVTLSNASGATISQSQATGTITNDDALPSLSIAGGSISEGNSGSTNLVLAVTLSAASSQSVTVNYATANGSATSGSDYTATSGTLTFAAGVTSQNISVPVLGDLVLEANETFTVTLSNASGATISQAQATGTITNDDALPVLSIANASTTEGNSGTKNLSFTVTLTPASAQVVTLNYATADGTAVAGTDYNAGSGTVSFSVGATSRTITVVLRGDTLDENNETFFVNLTNPTNATISVPQAVGTITDNDAAPNLTINSVSTTEGNTGTKTLDFTVTLSTVSGRIVTVNYATANGTATTAGNDYVSKTGTLTFSPGTTTQPIPVTINGDSAVEPNETFTVVLSGATNAGITTATGTGTITNDDTAGPTLSINDVTLPEGNASTTNMVFTVTLSVASSQTITVNYATAAATATSGADFTAVTGTLTFNPNITSQTINVPIVGDALNELNETFQVNLSGAVNASIAKTQGIGTITDDDPQPSLSIADLSVAEGNAGSANAVLTVTLSAASGQTVSVNFATSNGTATAGSDYTTASGTLTFNPGVTSQTIPVPVAGDTLFENDESFTVTLTTPVNATISRAAATGTITNDDTAPSLSIANVTQTEGNSGTSNAAFTVTLSAASGLPVTVNFATSAGTATAGSDYVEKSGTLTFNPGVTSQPIAVVVNGDTTFELDETFTVSLSGAAGASISQSAAVGTISNDDPQPTLSIASINVTEGNAGTTNAVFTVTLSAASGLPVTVNFATTAGSATSGSDYVENSGALTFNPGVTTQQITVVLNGDTTFELDETFTVSLSGATGAGISQAQATGTITNDDAAPTLSIDDVTLNEGNAGSASAVFTVTLSQSSILPTTVNFSTAPGTALAGSDFTAASSTLTFDPGVTSQTITVFVVGDTLHELDESFTVNLSGPTNATLSKSSGVATITNDDAQPSISISDISVSEGNSGTSNATFTVSISAASGLPVTVNFATSAGSASAGTDYVEKSGTLTFNPGVTTQQITVVLNGDTTFESDETFTVSLSGASGATLGQSAATGTVVNDDSQPTLSIAPVSVTEGNAGVSSAVFTVTLSAPSSLPVTVNFATADGSANAGSDYQAASGSLTFDPGVTTQQISVPVNGDTDFESNETFFVNLSGATNAGISQAQATGTITNDDAGPTLSIDDVTLSEGNAGSTNAVFTVTLSQHVTLPVTVNFSTAPGTALAGGDFTAASGTLTFEPGVTTQQITVLIAGDTLNELDESFTVNLSGATNATLSKSSGVATILNDDSAPSLSIANVTQAEGNAGTTSAVFTVTLSAASGQTVTVNFATTPGTALAEIDFTSAAGTLTFSAGVISQTVSVPVIGDTSAEPNETFFLNLSSPANATLARTQATATILDNDSGPGLSINDVSITEGNSGTANVTFTVTLSPVSTQVVTVAYATANGTAIVGSDYNAASGTLSFTAGATSRTFTVAVRGDTSDEPAETFVVNLSSPTNATLVKSQGTATINDNDAAPSLRAGDVSLPRPSSGTATANFSVILSAPSGFPVTVNYATANGTAVAGTDYTAASGTLTIDPGQFTKTVPITILGGASQPNRTFTLNLTVPTNATIADAQGLGTITPATGTVVIDIADTTVVEPNTTSFADRVFAITLSQVSTQDVRVTLATANITALASTDYIADSGTLMIPAGQTSLTFTIRILNNTADAISGKKFLIRMSNPVAGVLARSESIATIVNP